MEPDTTPDIFFSIFGQLHLTTTNQLSSIIGLFWVFFSLHDYVYIREFLLKFLSIATACPGRI